jgi:hypothetical protein
MMKEKKKEKFIKTAIEKLTYTISVNDFVVMNEQNEQNDHDKQQSDQIEKDSAAITNVMMISNNDILMTEIIDETLN